MLRLTASRDATLQNTEHKISLINSGQLALSLSKMERFERNSKLERFRLHDISRVYVGTLIATAKLCPRVRAINTPRLDFLFTPESH